MLLYISSNENVGIFDFLQDEKGLILKKLSGSFQLKQFVIYDMRSLSHYHYVAIDIKALKDSVSEIIEAVIAIKKMFSSRVIFYIDDIKNHEKLVQKLMDEGIYNIISADTVEGIRNDILKATSDLGMTKKDIQMKLFQKELNNSHYMPDYTFKEQIIRIGITGADHKVGTTTTAINLCNYLASIGAAVCYVEANDHGHLRFLPTEYVRMTVKDDTIIYNGVKYLQLNSECHDEFDFVIYDMGVIEHKVMSAIKNKCEVAILCATGKPYEISSFERATMLIGASKVHLLFSFVPESIKVKMKTKYSDICFAEYSPDLFDGDKNMLIWERIIEPYVTKK